MQNSKIKLNNTPSSAYLLLSAYSDNASDEWTTQEADDHDGSPHPEYAAGYFDGLAEGIRIGWEQLNDQEEEERSDQEQVWSLSLDFPIIFI